MIKSDFAAKIAEKAGLTKVDATKVVDAGLEILSSTLKAGEEVKFLGFGNFKVVDVPARKSRNPRTGETINLPARKRIKFKVSSALKV